jgi:hypothetical protein
MDHWRRKNKQRLALPILEVWRPSRQEVPSPDIFMELYEARYIEIAVVAGRFTCVQKWYAHSDNGDY